MKTGLAFFSSKCCPYYCSALSCILLHFSCRGWLIPPSPLGQAPKWHCRHHRGWQADNPNNTNIRHVVCMGCLLWLSHCPLHWAPYPRRDTGTWDTQFWLLEPRSSFTEALHSLVKVNWAVNIKIYLENWWRLLMNRGNLRWVIFHLYSCVLQLMTL